MGWQWPCGPRQNPGPHPSATFTIAAPALPTGAGVTAALLAVASAKASAAPKTIVFIIISRSPWIEPVADCSTPIAPARRDASTGRIKINRKRDEPMSQRAAALDGSPRRRLFLRLEEELRSKYKIVNWLRPA
jgi:hypothetical protein